MTQNNIYMEDENLVLYVDVLPDIQDTVTAASSSASASAASASASAATASGLVESIRNIKSGVEVFVAQAIESLHDLYNNIQTELNSLKETIIQNINTAYTQVTAALQQTEETISARIRNLGSVYVGEARGYAAAAREIVDFHVSTEHLNQSKAIETGDISDDLTVLQKVRIYAHSTFDSTKYTVAGTLTVPDTGIVTGFSYANHLRLSNSVASQSESGSWRINFAGVLPQESDKQYSIIGSSTTYTNYPLTVARSSNSKFVLSFTDSNSAAHTAEIAGNKITPHLGDDFIGYAEFDGDETYTLGISFDNGTTWETSTVTTSATVDFDGKTLEVATGVSAGSSGKIDLKYFDIYSNGIGIFNGNLTGTDTYTIGGNSVSIPYRISRTGSKIADGYYRTQVAALYAQQGYTPYYTLGINDFTLPCGEIYGMLENLRKQIDELAT